MSAIAVTDEVLRRIDTDRYDLIVLNFANMDMVGHTGVLDAAIAAVQVVDQCVGRIADKVLSKKGALLITADHGNSETMILGDGRIHTAHTTNPVPCILINGPEGTKIRPGGKLADVAPTILEIMKIEKPVEMTGESLLVR